jgi:hypothetical protein
MWLAHAIFWPVLALSHYAGATVAGAIAVFASSLLLAFTHEGALVLLLAILPTLAPRGLQSNAFRRAAANLIVIVVLAIASKMLVPPDDYYADAFMRAALHFFDPAIFEVAVVVTLLAAVVTYAAMYGLISIYFPKGACLYSFGALLVFLCVYWLRFDHSVLANDRYYLRTAVLVATFLLGIMAALAAMTREGLVQNRLATFQQTVVSSQDRICALTSLLVAVTLIHAVETVKFVSAWSHYQSAIAALAVSNESDAALSDPRFVSSRRVSPELALLAWFSTIPYLSVILANFRPNRLVIDPAGNYFWLSCATATSNAKRELVVPVQAREWIRIYSCLHR